LAREMATKLRPREMSALPEADDDALKREALRLVNGYGVRDGDRELGARILHALDAPGVHRRTDRNERIAVSVVVVCRVAVVLRPDEDDGGQVDAGLRVRQIADVGCPASAAASERAARTYLEHGAVGQAVRRR
jgi:hypothetical protein